MFEENQINNGQLLLENVKTIQIIGCTFDIDSQSKSSIYCLNNKFGSEIELIGCTFDIDCAFFSKTSKNTHYIDGKLLDKESPRIKINEGVFESQKQYVFNLKLMNEINNESDD